MSRRWDGSRLWGLCLITTWGAFLSGSPWIQAASSSPPKELRMNVPAGYLPGIPILVRLDLRAGPGPADWQPWNTTVTLSTDPPTVSVSPHQITLRNGRGSALVTVSGGGDFTLSAQWQDQMVGRLLTDRAGEGQTQVAGVLTGSASTWEGLVRVTADLTVPAGHQLTIQPGTMVLVDGAASGTSTTDLFVEGTMQILGTEEQPVVITASDPLRNWGQIRHNNAAPSLYRHVFIQKGGRAPGEGHTGTAPLLRLDHSTVRFEHCVLSDLNSPDGTMIGKSLAAMNGSDLTFLDCLLARSRMGPEISGTALYAENTYFMEMRGPDDDDGIYIHSQQAGQAATLNGCVVYGTDDDGIDTLGSTVTITNCLIRDVFDKGTSVFHQEVRIWRSLYVDCGIGISSKTGNDETVRTRLDHCTVLGRDRGIAAENKGGTAPRATVLYFITNSIIQATVTPANAIYTDYDPAQIFVSHSDILGEAWPGLGNFSADPQFVSRIDHDFQLQPGSPCIDTGDPSVPLDPDGSVTEVGYYAFEAEPPWLEAPGMTQEGWFTFLIHGYTNRFYTIEATTPDGTWSVLNGFMMTNSPVRALDGEWPRPQKRFYRVRVGP